MSFYCVICMSQEFLFYLQICRALAYIHNCIGICHRDIKPQNLLVRITSNSIISFSVFYWMEGFDIVLSCSDDAKFFLEH